MSENVKSERKGLFGRMFKSGPEVDAHKTQPQDAPAHTASAANGEGFPADGAADDVIETGDQFGGQTNTAEPADSRGDTSKKGWLSRLREGLSKTSSRLSDGITGLFSRKKIDAQTLEDFEDLLIQADLGVETAMQITEQLSRRKVEKGLSPDDVRQVLADEVTGILEPVATPLDVERGHSPHVIVMVGVNGTGKTTTIGKLALKYRNEGKSVLLAAGDTFRAAAIDQLKVWADRTGAAIVARDVGSDASGLAFDAIEKAKSEGVDVVLIDTAGRLQNKAELMAELEKVMRVIGKVLPGAPHDVVLVLDATTGQNALQQVEVFKDRAGVSGLVMTKLDGTARGGILVAISKKHGLPVHAVGVGEGVEDLQPFDARSFAEAIADLRD